MASTDGLPQMDPSMALVMEPRHPFQRGQFHGSLGLPGCSFGIFCILYKPLTISAKAWS
ncbi:MAG: hypothetical protein WC284_05570 [Candidimonas sp.]